MKKLRERLSNKKGFTLVELIVVIVIILILAAVLIPNVMRYIESARKSAFQSEASGYLTEVTGFEAEWYAKTNCDLDDADNGWSAAQAAEKYAITQNKVIDGNGKVTFDDVSEAPSSVGIFVQVEAGAVTAFGYCDGKYTVYWSQTTGWTNVDEPKAGA